MNVVINIDVPKEELLARAKNRALNSNRKDDQSLDTHLKRINVFEFETRPAIEYMEIKFNVVNINGLGTIDNITKTISQAIFACR